MISDDSSNHEFPSRSLDKVVVRLPDGMRDQLRQAAETNGRSMNSEIVARLQGYEDLTIQLFASQTAQVQHALTEFAASQKAYSDTMVLNLNNLARFVLEHSAHIPPQLVEAAQRNFDFTETYLSKLKAHQSSPHKDALGLPLFRDE